LPGPSLEGQLSGVSEGKAFPSTVPGPHVHPQTRRKSIPPPRAVPPKVVVQERVQVVERRVEVPVVQHQVELVRTEVPVVSERVQVVERPGWGLPKSCFSLYVGIWGIVNRK